MTKFQHTQKIVRDVREVDVTVPMVHTGMVLHTRIDGRLTQAEAQTARDIMDGVEATGRPCRSTMDVFRFLLEQARAGVSPS